MGKPEAKYFIITVGAIFFAGLVMNAMRSNSLVKQAISGYDA
ncbi:hypothetical protein [Parvibaculum sp.]|nr:hypothetical protein [Parvibaculum sp.]